MLLLNLVAQHVNRTVLNKHKAETNRSRVETHAVNLISNPWKTLCHWQIILLFHNTHDNIFL